MPVSIADVRAAAARYRAATRKTDYKILSEMANTDRKHFDIFLSHSFDDHEMVVGTKKLIEDKKLTVYVDWIDDPELDRSSVDRNRADHLRIRMQQCDTLFYAHTPNAALSKWCPWELGYFDALRAPDRRVYILPVVDNNKYTGQEYLSLYEDVELSTYKHRPVSKVKITPTDADKLREKLDLVRPPYLPIPKIF